MDLSKLASSVLEEYGIEPENISVVSKCKYKNRMENKNEGP